ncbi:MAG: hypothetical protein AB1521_06605 [Bacteroidota bacterium]
MFRRIYFFSRRDGYASGLSVPWWLIAPLREKRKAFHAEIAKETQGSQRILSPTQDDKVT